MMASRFTIYDYEALEKASDPAISAEKARQATRLAFLVVKGLQSPDVSADDDLDLLDDLLYGATCAAEATVRLLQGRPGKAAPPPATPADDDEPETDHSDEAGRLHAIPGGRRPEPAS